MTNSGDTTVATNGTADTSGGVFHRLPGDVKPSHYDISLKVDLENFIFEGQQRVDIELLKPTDTLTLYAKKLEIQDSLFSTADGKTTGVKLVVEYDETWSILKLKMPDGPVGPCSGYLDITFKGVLNDDLKGFYRSKYAGADGVSHYMATTQFESTSARMAFPCWDEPIYKATFDVRLTVPEGKTALSNGREVSTEPGPESGWKTVRFARTPIMSTYLVAFVVSDLEYVEGHTPDAHNVRCRVYCVPGKKDQCHFALELALKAIPFYTEYFGIPYVMDKCDLIAVPDFDMGAMENWGLVTYREVYLLLNPKLSSTSAKQNIALVVGHELAHMWFGNLVTMEWWTDLWLKEGYATFMEYFFVHAIFPEWDMWTQFIVHETSRAMSLDALRSSHPIEVPINDPTEVDEIYDGISYAKSSSVIRMLHAYLGDNVFRSALGTYLEKFKFSNAQTLDLWAILTEISGSGEDVAGMMRNWTQRQGYPVIKATGVQEGGNREIHVEQSRFLSDGTESEEKTVWNVPITITTSTDPSQVQRELLTEPKMSFLVENVPPTGFVKLNAQYTGYYRVQYDDALLKPLVSAIKTKTLGSSDRFNLVNDVYSLARSGAVSVTQFFDVLECLTDETDMNVWLDVDSSVSALGNIIQRTDYQTAYNAFIRKLYSKIAESLGWEAQEGESSSVAQLRPIVLNRLGLAGDEAIIKEARARFLSDLDGSKPLDPNLRSKVYSLMMKNFGEEAFASLTKLNETSEFSEVQRNCLMSIGQNAAETIHQKALEYAMSDKVRLQDLYLVIFGVSATKAGQESAWEFFKKNVGILAEKSGSESSNVVIHSLKMSCSRHCSLEKATEIEAFFAGRTVPAGLSRPIQQSLEAVRLNAALLGRDEENMKQWLTEHGY